MRNLDVTQEILNNLIDVIENANTYTGKYNMVADHTPELGAIIVTDRSSAPAIVFTTLLRKVKLSEVEGQAALTLTMTLISPVASVAPIEVKAVKEFTGDIQSVTEQEFNSVFAELVPYFDAFSAEIRRAG